MSPVEEQRRSHVHLSAGVNRLPATKSTVLGEWIHPCDSASQVEWKPSHGGISFGAASALALRV